METNAAHVPAYDGREGFRRHSRAAPCPVCGGHAGLRKGKGVRCAGFTLDRVVYCTREEHAGPLPLELLTSPPAYRHRLFGRCPCGAHHGWGAVGRSSDEFSERKTPQQGLVLDGRNEIYAAALDWLELRPDGLRDLTRRGLSSDAALHAGYRSLPTRGNQHRDFIRELVARFGEETLRRCPGFLDKNGRLGFWTALRDHDGYIVPYRDEEGRITGIQAKYLEGRYLTARGTRLANVYHVSGRGEPGSDLYLTEGATKANVASHLARAWCFAVAGQALMPEHIAAIEVLRPGRVIVALDQEDNANRERARELWLRALPAAGLSVYRTVWEGEDVGGPKGLDDLFLTGERPRIRRVSFPPAAIGQRRTPREAGSRGPVALGTTIDHARTVTGRAVSDFVSNARRNGRQALLVRTPPGAGKTTAAGQAIRRSRIPARVLVGTTRLARGGGQVRLCAHRGA